jgi:hypothetical protein
MLKLEKSVNDFKSSLYAKNLPWNVYREDELGPVVMNFIQDHEPYYKRWAQKWYENFQFLMGNQNLRWSQRYDFAVDYDMLLRKRPAMNQKIVTNLARGITEALASYLFGGIPDWDVETADESSIKGKRARIIVQKVLDCYMERLCMSTEFNVGAVIMALQGQVGFKIDWNPMGGSLLDLPDYEKLMKPEYTDYMAPNPITGGLFEVPTQILGSDGRPITREAWEKQTDDMGREIIKKVLTGDVCVNVKSPFEYRRPIGSSGMHKDRWIEEIRILDYDEYLDEYSNVAGQTRLFKRVKPIFHDPALYAFAARHFLRMQFTSPPTLSDQMRRMDYSFKSSLFRQKVVVVEHYDRPHPRKWPQGRRLVITNGLCTHITKPSYSTNKLDGWHPYAEAQWMRAYPSNIGLGPLNDTIQKNRELNVKDSLIATAVRRNMGSQLLIKTGAGIDRDQFSGEPGAIMEVGDPFGARWLHDEMPISPVISKLREFDKEDVYEASGAGDALRGERSPGATSGYQARQIQEREERRITQAKTNWEACVSTVGEKIFACLRANAVQLDKGVMGFLMRSAAGKFSVPDVVTLLSAPADYGIEIKVKKSSMSLKSEATELATIQELAQNPVVQQRMQDAGVLDEYLKRFGVEVLRDKSASHRDRAQRENETFLDLLRLGADAEGIPLPAVFFEDDDDIHMNEHADMFVQNTDEFRTNELRMMQFHLHMEQHRLQKQEKEAKLITGASQQAPAMMQASRSVPLPNAQTIQIDSQRRAAEAQKQPQAPKLPKAEPGGPANRQTDPSAPSANTAADKGGPPQ